MHINERKRITLVGLMARWMNLGVFGFACFFCGPLEAMGGDFDKQGTQWAPFLEWSVENPTFTGNPYDVVASATFIHNGSGETRTTEMFFAGGTTWKFRFTGTRTGTWNFSTSSGDSDLNGKLGVVTILPNPNPAIKGFISTQNNKFAREVGNPNDLEGFIPNVYMNIIDFGTSNECGWTDISPTFQNTSTRNSYIDEVEAHGANGVFALVVNQWFKAHKDGYDQHSSSDPDSETFQALEETIVDAHQRGMFVHIWAWGDEARKWTPVGVGGVNGTPDKRMQRYLAARLGPLPGWMMSYGFDLEEWANESQVGAWANYLHSHMGWRHLLMARKRTNSNMDVLSNDSRVDSNFYQDAKSRLGNSNRPIMFERRFTYKRDNIFSMDTTRRAFWEFTLAGGAGSIWGFYPTSCTAYNGRPYPNPEQLRTYAEFWKKRFFLDFEIADQLTNGHALKTPSNSHYVFYRESASSVAMDLSGAPSGITAVAVDTKLNYVEINLGVLSTTNQTWTAPYHSDWAIAVGNFGGVPDTTPPATPTGLKFSVN